MVKSKMCQTTSSFRKVSQSMRNFLIYFFRDPQRTFSFDVKRTSKKIVFGKINSSLHSRRGGFSQATDFSLTKKTISGSQKLGTDLALYKIRDLRSEIRSTVLYIRFFCFSSSPSGEAGRLGKKTKKWSRLGGALSLTPLADPGCLFVFSETLVGRGSAPPNLAGEGLPPRPSIRWATIPHPPQVKESDSEEAKAVHLAQAYRGALWARYKTRSFAFTRGAPSSWKQFKMLVSAAEIMHQKRIAPAPWAYWSFRLWEKINEKRPSDLACAPVYFVFAKSRLEGHTGQFRREGSLTKAGLRWFGPIQTKLIERYEALAAEALHTPPDLMPDLVSRHFPGTSLQDLTSMAQCEADQQSELLNKRLERGEWLW